MAETATYCKAVGAGMLAGMRSMAAPALVSQHLAHTHHEELAGSRLEWMESPQAAHALKALAAAEMVADKTPWVPDRTSAMGLAGRAASGALVGAVVCIEEGCHPAVGALLGCLGAVAATYGMYHLRARIGKATPVPDAVLGLIEDGIVVGAGRALFNGRNGADAPAPA